MTAMDVALLALCIASFAAAGVVALIVLAAFEQLK